MSQSLTLVFVHIIFSTKNRMPFLQSAELRSEVHAYEIRFEERYDQMEWKNKLSHCTYSASRLVCEVPGPISPGCSLFAPLALRKTSPNSHHVTGCRRKPCS